MIVCSRRCRWIFLYFIFTLIVIKRLSVLKQVPCITDTFLLCSISEHSFNASLGCPLNNQPVFLPSEFFLLFSSTDLYRILHSKFIHFITCPGLFSCVLRSHLARRSTLPSISSKIIYKSTRYSQTNRNTEVGLELSRRQQMGTMKKRKKYTIYNLYDIELQQRGQQTTEEEYMSSLSSELYLKPDTAFLEKNNC